MAAAGSALVATIAVTASSIRPSRFLIIFAFKLTFELAGAPLDAIVHRDTSTARCAGSRLARADLQDIKLTRISQQVSEQFTTYHATDMPKLTRRDPELKFPGTRYQWDYALGRSGAMITP